MAVTDQGRDLPHRRRSKWGVCEAASTLLSSYHGVHSVTGPSLGTKVEFRLLPRVTCSRDSTEEGRSLSAAIQVSRKRLLWGGPCPPEVHVLKS